MGPLLLHRAPFYCALLYCCQMPQCAAFWCIVPGTPAIPVQTPLGQTELA
jgi:hypothetical protein